MDILMVAAENGALPGGKVGGIGDVLRDLPRALAARGHRVTVVTPGYRHFSRLTSAVPRGRCEVDFAGRRETLEWYRVWAPVPCLGVKYLVVEHDLFAAAGAGVIYSHDPPGRPFATDASRFALFCLGVAQGLAEGILAGPRVLHLHDWHAALLALLLRRDRRFETLDSIPTVYTIHNLSLQGIRPLSNDESSLAAWYPGVGFPLDDIVDPRYHDCVNPTRAALRLCDRVHAVSPSYVREILQPSEPGRGFTGGEGLEGDLRKADAEGRLVGALNGVTYPEVLPPRVSRRDLFAQAQAVVDRWLAWEDNHHHRLARQRLADWQQEPESPHGMLVTSIGRMAPQKLSLLLQPGEGGTALEGLLDRLGDQGRMILLGSGDPGLEQRFMEIAGRWRNLLFLRGYAEDFVQLLYASGDLFLMPSSFEPCGISQMLAMRCGQPCLVHGVGGLRDTVEHGVTGFVFNGDAPDQQARNMLAGFEEALALWREDPAAWERLRQRATARRFTWEAAVQVMEQRVYSFPV